MPDKDCATLEAEIAKDEPSRLLIEIALRQPLAPAAPVYDATEIQRTIRNGFREIVAQVELQRLMKAGNPPKSRASRWAGRVVAFLRRDRERGDPHPVGLSWSTTLCARMALSHLARRGSLAAPCRLAKSLNLLNPSLTVRQVMSSKNG